MNLKAALMGLLALALATPAMAAGAAPSPAAMLTPEAAAVPLVDCGDTSGSAFRISPHYLVTAYHVVSGAVCQINGEPIKVIYTNKTLDYAIIETATASSDYLRISCDGFQAQHLYIAAGHARGLPQILEVPLMGTGSLDRGQGTLTGILTVQPGQSGGPVLDATTGKVVGVVDSADWEDGLSWSAPLQGTPLCPIKN
jgi:S1-C subfamily serine protease